MNDCTAGAREQLVVALVTDGGQVWRWSAQLPFPPGPPDAAAAHPLAATALPTLRGAPVASWNAILHCCMCGEGAHPPRLDDLHRSSSCSTQSRAAQSTAVGAGEPMVSRVTDHIGRFYSQQT